MDRQTLVDMTDFTRARLLGSLEAIEKSGQNVAEALAFRPAPGRAHIAWQAMHCAATHHKYLHLNLLGTPVEDPALLAAFASGSTPSDQDVPSLAKIRGTLATTYELYRSCIVKATPEQLSRVLPTKRTAAESFMLLAWHEAHHQGQIHLTWNIFKAMH